MKSESSSWEELLENLNKSLGINKNLMSVLFIMGLQEKGSGFKNYSQEEKTEIIKTVQFNLLCKNDYYIKPAKDLNGQAIWIENPDKEIPDGNAYEKLLKNLVLNYFNTKLL